MSLIVTGTIGIDTVETPDGQRRENVLGGSCTYFSAAASYYHPVRMVAAVGDDFPQEHRDLLAKFPKVNTEGLETRAGSKTFRWGGKYMENMDHRESLFTDLGVLEEAPPVVPDSYKDSKFIFLANTHPAVQLGMLEQFPQRALAVADTMDLWIDTAREELEALLHKLDGLVLNYDEAEQLTGIRNSVAAGRRILEYGPRFVVVKKGEHGCLFIHEDGIAAYPAYPTEIVVDPTGAGDTFAGGMMGSIAEEASKGSPEDAASFDVIRRGLIHGTIIASFTIESFSLDRLTELSPETIRGRYDEFAAITRTS